ncbi:MAG: hypothetical protein KBT75_02945 [Oleispira antarctica]|uniref:Uncharacterized protein n=1 Tax=Oleispira antarctica RB-8 TaxID=698738 RepID=R4YUQ3_OLEAN|nr:hypothetical protein [Oleispira antarctica]MBQ0794161.1 hypothetical protein [Oleispira antarctica]CCK78058.1 conserved hypothetical protein [Oleispira antarctica RB-8]|tara:strand:+ start:1106 stop:1597 length:492 start_codon:yes stop_codon:yes gene_type:complete
MSDIPLRLGQILLAKHTITERQLELALQYQALHNKPVGHCLMALGFIEQKDLNRALRRQSWLKPCAACLTCLCAPFTFAPCFADENSDDDLHPQWTEQHDPYSHWSNNVHLSENQLATVDVLKVAAGAAWGIYQGEPRSGEWQYAISKQTSNDGYSITMQMFF